MQQPELSNKPEISDTAVDGVHKYQVRQFDELLDRSKLNTREALTRHNYRMLWTFAANGFLGLCLMTSPWLFDYKSVPLLVNDIVCGALVIFLEIMAFQPRFVFCRWCTAAVAFWLFLAPLAFWSPTPAVYLMDSITACLLITFAILVPGVPGRGDVDLVGPDQPPGWTYNPSSWIRRWLGIFLALLGFFISRYLAAHQLHFTPHAWDPFFGDGSDRVLTSSVSRSFPISDAGFGAVAYVMEVLTGFMGDRARWRTAPWIVLMFALLVIPLGATSVILVMLQPVVVHAWCGFCLVAAVFLLSSVPLAVHEVIAVGQFLLAAKAQKKNIWQIFWLGGDIIGAGERDPDRLTLPPKLEPLQR